MKLIEVSSPETQKEFLLFPVRLYKNEKNWIRPLDKDINEVFDPEKNKFFRHGEVCRWLLQNDKGQTIGRVAAFINKKTAKATKYITGGMGFFECINDQTAANALFDQCKKWLEERGMECMEGPINFGERMKWWGLLVDGFVEPNYCTPYNFAYYQNLLEQYGFKEYFKQFTFHRLVSDPLPTLYADKADRIARDPRYTFESIKKSKLEKFAEDFKEIYNKAWGKHTGVAEITSAIALTQMKQMKPVMDEDLVWFAYHDGKPVAFFIMIPELNQLFKHMDGQFNWFAKLKFLYHKMTGSCKKMFGVVFGIVPEFQGKGLEGAIVTAAAKRIQPMGRYTEFEMNWIGDFNPKMMHICEQVGGKVVKTHITYRVNFDPTKEHFRHPIIE
jgi:GNAT superfamily N-acetyltransferase